MKNFYRLNGLAVMVKESQWLSEWGFVSVRYIGPKGKEITADWFDCKFADLEDFWSFTKKSVLYLDKHN